MSEQVASPPVKVSASSSASGPTAAANTPDSDVSPTSQPPPSSQSDDKPTRPGVDDYFSHKSTEEVPTARLTFASPFRLGKQDKESATSSASNSTVVSPAIASAGVQDGIQPLVLDDGDERPSPGSRKSSIASVSFRAPRNPSLPQGQQRKTDARRLRASSPSPVRFRSHVAFDNLVVGEATKSNTPSYTVNVRHDGYHPKRRSRTFMVGVDEHPYSNDALQWLLDEFVDDGDEVICVRVVEKDVRAVGAKDYQDEANAMIAKIQEKSGNSRAISIVLEYAVGKLHSTFQRLIQMYQPSMLIVGTRGRSLGGMQGLLNTRNSFSKYCLQYSPIPVVVVRPDEKRQKKKDKRSADPDKQSYIKMLAVNRGLHEADSENSSLYDIETKLSPDEEAHKVAAAIGLPAAFDPTLKPIKEKSPHGPRQSVASVLQALDLTEDEPGRVVAAPVAAPDSGEESGDDDEDDEVEFDVASGSQILQSKKKERLHEMEVGEAAALLKSNPAVDETSSDEDDEDGGGEIGKQSSSST